jgi:hypothetical protein
VGKSERMYSASVVTLSTRASSRAKRFDAGPVWSSARPAPGAGVAIEIMPFISSATTVCTSGEWVGDSSASRRVMRFSDDSHCNSV